jgi:hypothetical protein
MKMTIEIDNITEAQARAIEDMLALWQHLGAQDGSRWTAFFADGNGGFRPEITVDGKPAERFMPDIGVRWGQVAFLNADGHTLEEMYLMDYDRVQRAMASAQPREEFTYFEDPHEDDHGEAGS